LASVPATNLSGGGKKIVAAVADSPDRRADVARCIEYAQEFISKPTPKGDALQKAVDRCAQKFAKKDRNYVCTHFREALEGSFETLPASATVDAQTFCEATEGRMLELRGATRIPSVGTGPMTDFKVSERCMKAVEDAMAPKKTMHAAHVPDFWYTFCLNQNCAHFLPSRTRWCNVQQQPTHGVRVCEAARKFAVDEVAVRGDGQLMPDEVCSVYAEFVEEMGIDVEAYEHVVHGDSRQKVPSPGDPERALQSSQMKNDATKGDFESQPPTPKSGSVSGHTLGKLTVLIAAGAAVFADL